MGGKANKIIAVVSRERRAEADGGGGNQAIAQAARTSASGVEKLSRLFCILWDERNGLREETVGFRLGVCGKRPAQKLGVGHGADRQLFTLLHPSIKQGSRSGIFSQRSDEEVGVEVNHLGDRSRNDRT